MQEQQFDSFSSLDAYWEGREEEISQTYGIGPFQLELVFASSFLAQKLGKAFAHLSIPSSTEIDLTIRVTDTRKQKLPFLDWRMIDQLGYRGIYVPPIYWHHFAGIGALSALHLEKNRAYYIVRDEKELPWWVGGSPFQVILHAWLREKRLQLTHAAAVAKGDRAVLLAGKGGSGKSTTVFSCLQGGLDSLSEDYCLLDLQEPPQVYSVYQSAKWRLPTRKFFPEYESHIHNPEQADTEKALLFYQDLFPQQLKRRASVQALLSLQVGSGARPQIKRQEKKEALRDLMMSTLSQLPFHQGPTMNILASFVSKIETFQLTLGQDLQANVDLIGELLQ